MRWPAPRRTALGVSAAALSAGAGLLLAAPPAWALCPNCLGQNDTLTPTMRLVGVFLLVPPAVFFLVARVVRRLNEDRAP
jgi:hypothetical protein